MFQKFELWIADATGISVQMKMYEKGGNYTVVSYPNMKLDANVSDAEVRLNPPKGVTRNPVCK
jgi:outer membrane lipoprotein-sorting protein